MTLTPLLQRFHHLALAASGICLVVALQPPILPRTSNLLWALPMLTLLAGRLHGRWVLPALAANALALLMAGLTLVWIYQNWGNLSQRPMPVALIPYLGPLLLVLLVLRLFRPYASGDLWMLQGMGLLQVAFACTLTTEFTFGLLLLLYLALLLPFLRLAQLDRARRRAGTDEQRLPVPRLGGPTFGWTLAVFLSGLALFFLTPRLTWESWDPLRQLGVRAPSAVNRVEFYASIDLNRTTLKLGTGDAFRVRVESNLPDDVHWRTGVLNWYLNGNWRWQPIGPGSPGTVSETLPELGSGSMVLNFSVARQDAGGLPLAEPILFGKPPLRRTVLTARPEEYPFLETEGTLLSPLLRFSRQDRSTDEYQQVTVPGRTRWPLVQVPGQLGDGFDPQASLLRNLQINPVPQLTEWTGKLLQRLAEENRFGLTREGVAPRQPTPDGLPPQAELLARALTAYLARSGDFTYTLDLRREDRALDPTLDFLWNVRQGHCERFASALALMLRSQGIPARLVRGFRGATEVEPGVYVVSQQSAHAWVEALVPAREHDGLDWISLEPTPAFDGELNSDSVIWDLWDRMVRWQQSTWRDLIVGYDANRQMAMWQNKLTTYQATVLLLGLGGSLVSLVGLIQVLRWLWRPRPTSTTLASISFLHRLWQLLSRHRLLAFSPQQTPRELAQAATLALAQNPATAELADIPGRLVDLFQRLRYAEEALTEAELHAAEAEVSQLEAALAAGGP